MKKELLAVGIIVLGISGFYLWWTNRKKKEPVKEEPKNEEDSNSPDSLLKKIAKEILKEDEWKNERDFLSTLTKRFIKEATSLSWIDHLPVCLDDLMVKLGEIGLLGEFEKKLEEKYIGGKK